MTRINSAISVKRLTDEHLLAEHREIKRLPFCLGVAIRSGSINKIPEKFTLGRGHVLFFLDKMQFIRARYIEIYNEACSRGFNVQSYLDNWNSVSPKYSNDYIPSKEEYQMLLERISTRIMYSPKKSWHYYGREISKEEAIELLNRRE